MEGIIQGITNYHIYITLGLAVLVIILFIMNIITLKSLSRVENRYRKFMRGVNNKNLEELVINYLDKVDEVKEDNVKVKELYNSINSELAKCIKKVSMVRYKAFEDVGSDLSFSVALLDEKNDGFILTGIYGRQESTTYAKPIDKGLSRYELSVEEKKVLEDAVSK